MSWIESLATIFENSTSTKYHTSDIDFCEKNNDTFIVESFNTWSSLVISLYGIIGLWTCKKINKHRGRLNLNTRLIVLYLNLVIIGICSAYFHSTLSSLGHLMDVYSI